MMSATDALRGQIEQMSFALRPLPISIRSNLILHLFVDVIDQNVRQASAILGGTPTDTHARTHPSHGHTGPVVVGAQGGCNGLAV